MPYLLHGHLNKRKLTLKYALNNQCDCKKVAYKLKALWKPGPCRVSSSNISGHKREHLSLNFIKLVYRGECWTAMVSDCYSTQGRVVLCSVFPLLEWSFVLANDDMSGGSSCVQGLRKELEGGASNFPLPQFVKEASSLVVCLMIRHDTQMII